MKYISRIDEYNGFAADPKTTPTTKPTPTETPTKFPRPSTPPQPSVDPGPKNWKDVLKDCVDRFNSLYAKIPAYTIKESLEDNPGIPSFKKFKAQLPKSNMQTFSTMGMLAMQTMLEIVEIEKATFTDDELESIAIDIVRKVIDGSALNKRGESFDNFKFDIKFDRGDNKDEDEDAEGGGMDMDQGVRKTPKKKNKPEGEELNLAVNKRELINALTQGFGIESQSRMFDADMEEEVDRINTELLQNYFKFMRAALESHKYLDIDMMKSFLEMMQKNDDALEKRRNDRKKEDGSNIKIEKYKPEGNDDDEDDDQDGGNQQPGMVAPARMEIEYVGGTPVIKVTAYCLILAIQEMVKGVFEVISHHGLKYSDEYKREIFDRTENWLSEQEGFIYGPMMVRIFKDFYQEVENNLIKRGVITEHDDSMMLYVLTGLYSQDITPDRNFMDIFSRIFNKDLDKDLWPISEVADIYEMALNSTDELDAASTGYSEPEPEEESYEDDDEDGGVIDNDEGGYANEEPVSAVNEPTIDDLLDKISEFGYDSLSQHEKDLLVKHSQNSSLILGFKNFTLLRESIKRW